MFKLRWRTSSPSIGASKLATPVINLGSSHPTTVHDGGVDVKLQQHRVVSIRVSVNCQINVVLIIENVAILKGVG